MRAAGQQLYGAPADGSAGVAYNSAVYPSSQPQYGAARPPGSHMGGPAQQGARTDPEAAAGPGPMKVSAKATMFVGQQQQQQQQQRSAPYPNPQHRYMQSRRPQFINGQTPAEVNAYIYIGEMTKTAQNRNGPRECRKRPT